MSDWEAEASAAGVAPGRRLVFVLEYSGGGIDATVERMADGIVFLSNGLRLRWAAVLGVRDDSPSSNDTLTPPAFSLANPTQPPRPTRPDPGVPDAVSREQRRALGWRRRLLG